MKPKPKKAKPVLMWALITKEGTEIGSIYYDRQMAENWFKMYPNVYSRIARVRITEVKKEK